LYDLSFYTKGGSLTKIFELESTEYQHGQREASQITPSSRRQEESPQENTKTPQEATSQPGSEMCELGPRTE
jgi:hypothetical protein